MTDPTILDDVDDPYRAIRVGDPGAGEATKWGQLLTLFMRIMALFWVVQGLMQWRVILSGEQPLFDVMPQAAAVAVIFFAVLDLIAAVGLWLATPWGGVLWLLIASAQIFVASSMPSFFAGGYWLIGIDLVLITLYFTLTFEAGRDFEARRVMARRRRRNFDPKAGALVRETPLDALWRQTRMIFPHAGAEQREPRMQPSDPAETPPPTDTSDAGGRPQQQDKPPSQPTTRP
jgi:hypothetical protein